jgi:hypothetical protein
MYGNGSQPFLNGDTFFQFKFNLIVKFIHHLQVFISIQLTSLLISEIMCVYVQNEITGLFGDTL